MQYLINGSFISRSVEGQQLIGGAFVAPLSIQSVRTAGAIGCGYASGAAIWLAARKGESYSASWSSAPIQSIQLRSAGSLTIGFGGAVCTQLQMRIGASIGVGYAPIIQEFRPPGFPTMFTWGSFSIQPAVGGSFGVG